MAYEAPSSSESKTEGGWMTSFISSVTKGSKGSAPRGIYLWGGVGCGKTMLMDLFYKTIDKPRKRRVHFHAFMLDLHKRMHELRTTGNVKGDPIPHITKEIIEECWLLCFDEFQVTDIADALVMRRLFDSLWEQGLVVFATSNRPPDDLYYNGIQRELFVPFIDECKERNEVHHLLSPTDYRLMGTKAATYMSPLNDTTQKQAEDLFHRLTVTDPDTSPKTVELNGRTLKVPMGSFRNGVAWFTFADLCAMPKGAEDFIAIADTFPTVFVVDVPTLTRNEMNQVRRFITLVDALYESRTKVVFTAQSYAHELFVGDGGPEDELFAFDRTVSRLTEMQSLEYLEMAGRREEPTIKGNMFASLRQGDRKLTDEEAQDLWNFYDADLNNEMTVLEAELLMRDLCQIVHGCDCITEDHVTEAFSRITHSPTGNKERDARAEPGRGINRSEFREGFGHLVEYVRKEVPANC
uniref:EF-hand domain-containing protein n=1 Tax=Lotharella globosa TaxID=91324 RepID=A0A7S3Z7F6_9EUKA